MLVAEDFRRQARSSLEGKWGVGVGTGLVASLLGAGTIFSFNNSSDFEITEEQLEALPEEAQAVLLVFMFLIAMIALVYSLVVFVIGGPITLGYVKFNLDLVDNKVPQFKDLFLQFNRFGAGFCVQFLRNLFIVLWELVFILPAVVLMVLGGFVGDGLGMIILLFAFVALIVGLVFAYCKVYSYAMAPYILYENPHMGAYEAIRQSTKLMEGNRWRLFCLGFSFIGWSLLCILTLGIGTLWLKPYQEASYAAFYRELEKEQVRRQTKEMPNWLQQ